MKPSPRLLALAALLGNLALLGGLFALSPSADADTKSPAQDKPLPIQFTEAPLFPDDDSTLAAALSQVPPVIVEAQAPVEPPTDDVDDSVIEELLPIGYMGGY